ncbi:MAG TPA: ATP-dependent sacrificial sulfur transferase LarE [Thermoplasmatales archaeon]|nr:ATP-dependent sacrificial sulfur transferase LarE [Thermoplasmatales archaeon]
MDMGDYHTLVERLRPQRRLAIAFSGGIDSSLVARAAVDAGIDALAITVDGPLFSRRSMAQAAEVAQEIGISQVVVTTDYLPLEQSPQRCHHCKAVLARIWKQTAREHGYGRVADGVTGAELADPRLPGARAAGQAGIWHPLAEAGMEEDDIRGTARRLGLSTWKAPGESCLASRVAFGEPVTRGKLHMVEAAEDHLHSLIGSGVVRVRLHGGLARIEVDPDDFSTLLHHRTSIARTLLKLGFDQVTLDLQGYRSGSMHVSRQGP